MLTKDIENVGQAGDVKEVTDGYGRNFLFPRKLAVPANRGFEAEAKRLKEAAVKRETKDRVEAQALADEINNKTVVVRLKMGAEDKAFGSITNQDIAAALKAQHRVEVDRHKIDVKEPIKTLGEHQVPLKLHRDVEAHVNVIVTQDRYGLVHGDHDPSLTREGADSQSRRRDVGDDVGSARSAFGRKGHGVPPPGG